MKVKVSKYSCPCGWATDDDPGPNDDPEKCPQCGKVLEGEGMEFVLFENKGWMMTEGEEED